jgi:glucokinase
VRLVADIGGTTLRVACTGKDGTLGLVERRAVADYKSFPDALDACLEALAPPEPPVEAAVAAAGPPDCEGIRLTNAPWIIRADEIAPRVNGGKVRLFNDLEAVALALPQLGAGDVAPLGAAGAGAGENRLLAVNVGTGFGAAVAVPLKAGGWTAWPGEAGHMALGAVSPDEAQAWERMAPPPQTVEDVLSGRGLAALYAALAGASASGTAASVTTPETVFARASTEPAARETIARFTELLGRVAGDLALATGSWGGVYFCGGLVAGWRAAADVDRFRAAFEAKGAMNARMSRVPAFAVVAENIALRGLASVPLD